MINCFIINLDHSTERWEQFTRNWGTIPDISWIRVSAVDISREKDVSRWGRYCPWTFRLLNGRKATNGEIGCYLSHLKALKMFLETDDEFAIICEDDIRPEPYFDEILQEALSHARKWNILRLGQCREKDSAAIVQLSHGVCLKICVKGFAYSGACLFDRQAAEFLVRRLAQMKVPWDLAIHRGWSEIREASLLPGIYVLDEISEQSTLGNRCGKTTFLSPFWWSAQLYKIFSRRIRYAIQRRRIRELKRPENDSGK